MSESSLDAARPKFCARHLSIARWLSSIQKTPFASFHSSSSAYNRTKRTAN